MRREQDFSLLKYNTFGIDATCREFFEYDSLDELQSFVRSGALQGKRWMQIGGGSNLLFLDDFDGIVLHSRIKGIERLASDGGDILVSVGSGVVWDDFVAYCVERGWAGVENLSLIPGEVGASPVQNIGAYGVEAKDAIFSVEALDVQSGEMHRFSNEACEFAYRDSFFKRNPNYIVTSVVYRLQAEADYRYNLSYGNLMKAMPEAELSLALIRKTIIEIRNAKLPDPKEIGSAGSFFKNPIVDRSVYERLAACYDKMPYYEVSAEKVKIPAGWLIEQCGWKGKKVGSAGVYEKQALVLVNHGRSSGREIWHLAQQIVDSVREKFGISISPEACVIKCQK